MIIFVAALFTVATFSFLVVTLGFRPAEREQPAMEEISLPVNNTIQKMLDNVTDPEVLDFFDYIFGTWEKINGVFEADFSSLKTGS